ncbi:MAG: heparinase II/III family protein [Akkermansiaceae bacterium]|nr:heparinase II/III family protein [Akkermansiaceae bacterium]
MKTVCVTLVFFSLAAHLTLQGSDSHPRILFPQPEEATVKKRIQSDPLAGALYKELLRRADHALRRPVCRYHIPDGKRLLTQSRYALNTILHTSMAWRLSGEKKYLDRAILELDAASGLKDWNTRHFLDTAEMSTAVAIGYDWLYHALSAEQRLRYATALRVKGLEPARSGFTDRTKAWWAHPNNNWAQVCATGLLFAERALEKPGDAIHPGRIKACQSLTACRTFYLPSGAYPEGPSYWHYGSNYHVLGLAVVRGERGDRPELNIPTPAEFKASPLFTEHLTGPSGMVFNFADAWASTSSISAAQSWMASAFNDPATCGFIRAKLAKDITHQTKYSTTGPDRFFPLHLLWLPQAPEKAAPPLPLDSAWQGSQPLATFRSSWEDPDALFVAVKGGYPGASHGQMDVGSFVVDSGGIRWAEDLGSDNYNMPGYFGSKRWSYFRLTNLGHNTLVIGGKLQNAKAKTCPMTNFTSSADEGSATFDLSPVYQKQADKMVRHCRLDRKNHLITLTDSITSPRGSVRWAMLTRASIEIKGSVVILKRSGKQLTVTRNDHHGGQWEILEAKPPSSTENQNKGVRILAFTAPAADKLELSVSFGQ